MKITVDGREYEVLAEFPVYHIGWEMDNVGWIISANRDKKIVLTNHGRKRFSSEKELRVLFDEYKAAHKLHMKALSIYKEKK